MAKLPPKAPLGAHGLPELPAGYFWRVKTRYGEGYGEYTEVSIRKEHWIGSRIVASSYINRLWDEDFKRRAVSPADIRKAARAAHEKWLASKAIVSYDGDYPPKRLEV